MTPPADAIAACVLAAFDQLPEKRKPRARATGQREWVPLAGIVLCQGDDRLDCVSLGTGMKCLPSSKLPLVQGNILHDWHAEVLAIRAFNCFLLDQCLLLSTPPYASSPFLCHRPTNEQTAHSPQPFTLKENVHIYMYCSEAPCGDASMELTMSAQDDPTPWTSPPPTISPATSNNCITGSSTQLLRGRSNFSLLGAVRCKPSRLDAPPTLSKSCTDKLALKQATSLLSSITSLFIAPGNAYMHTLILPASQLVPAACERAFFRSGRLAALTDLTIGSWGVAGYTFRPFAIASTRREFAWSKRSVLAGESVVPSNISAVWTPAWQETLIGGVLQGRKQIDPRGASRLCRRSMWSLAVQVAGLLGTPDLLEVLKKQCYGEIKAAERLAGRRRVKADMKKAGLERWLANTGDEMWSLG